MAASLPVSHTVQGDEIITERCGSPSKAQLQASDLRDSSLDRAHGLGDVRIPEGREFLTSLEAAAYLRYATLSAFYSWVCKHHVPREYVGKEARYRQRDLDEALRKDRRRVVSSRVLLVAHRKER